MSEEYVDSYCRNLEENIYLLMEVGKQSYLDIINMPVARFNNYFKWKTKFDEEVAKSRDDALKNIKLK